MSLFPPKPQSIVRTPTPEELARYRAALARVEPHAEEIKAQARAAFDEDEERALRCAKGLDILDLCGVVSKLRAARERQGKSVEEVSRGRRLTASDVRLLELSEHPAPRLGMLRDYANAVGLRVRVDVQELPQDREPVGGSRDEPGGRTEPVASDAGPALRRPVGANGRGPRQGPTEDQDVFDVTAGTAS